MSESPFSNVWYRVSELKPRLAQSAAITRHRYRGEAWYVVRDESSGRVHRFTPETYLLLGQMNGRRTLNEIWMFALERLRDDAPSQEEMIQLLGQLNSADLVQFDVMPDTAELLERHRRNERSRRQQRIASPLFIRIPLWDPDTCLQGALRWTRWMWHWQGAVAWLLLVPTALVLAGLNWDALTDNLSDRVLSAGNLVMLWTLFPVIKLMHEIGHGLATRVRGGEVHEIGLMLLVFTPVPYVDSSAANAFRSKYDRALVGAAGMLVETAIAALATFAWVLLEPGLARAACFNVMLIAGVSTIVFNLNPLLKYDGYFILTDLIEMPNLATRSQKLWVELIDRDVFHSSRVRPSRTLPGERRWLYGYAPLSSVYRLVVMLSIAAFIATRFFVFGVLLAAWSVTQGLLWPLCKGIWHVIDAPALATSRRRAVYITAATVTALLLLLFVIPAPHRAISEGIVWVPDDAQLRAESDGFVRELLIEPGSRVEAGTEITSIEDPARAAELALSEARLAESRARYFSLKFGNQAAAELARNAMQADEAALDRALTEFTEQRVSARRAGEAVILRAADLPGRFVRKGDLIGYVAFGENRLVRVIVPQQAIERVRGELRAIEVRLSPAPELVLPARLVREVPGGNEVLPSRALALEGGGDIAIDPSDEKGLRALNRFFEFDVEVQGEMPPAPLGARVYVRFAFAPLPLGWQLVNQVRQIFLARFDV